MQLGRLRLRPQISSKARIFRGKSHPFPLLFQGAAYVSFRIGVEMLGLFRESASIQLMKRMDRVINSTYQSLILSDSNKSDRRSEFRSPRSLSCMVLEINASNEIADCWPCITLDLSSRGSLVYATKVIPEQSKYIFVLHHGNDFVSIHAQCMRCAYNNFGGYQAGFLFTELVEVKGFPVIELFLEMLSTPSQA